MSWQRPARRAADPIAGLKREGSPWPLDQRWLADDASGAARHLLGAVLVSEVGGERTAGVIGEAEAYLGPHDPACHAAAPTGRTRRNAAMFGPAGSLYVYLSYGLHHCVNVVTGPVGFPAAVLVRALEPVEGLDVMVRRRGRAEALCSGPGRLAQALGIGLEHDGLVLGEGPVFLEEGRRLGEDQVGTSARIGISKARAWPLRYFVKGHPAVKAPRW
jgi:DNA-3-methyladenine glycosylase